jgi:hypothetical protein
MKSKKLNAGYHHISFRASEAFGKRIDAAARELGLDRSEFIRYGIVQLILDTPLAVRDRIDSGIDTREPSAGPRLADVIPSREELSVCLLYHLRFRSPLHEMEKGVADLEKRVADLEERAKRE